MSREDELHDNENLELDESSLDNDAFDDESVMSDESTIEDAPLEEDGAKIDEIVFEDDDMLMMEGEEDFEEVDVSTKDRGHSEQRAQDRARKSTKMAVYSVAVIAVFAAAFIGLLLLLDGLTPRSPYGPFDPSPSGSGELPVDEAETREPFYVLLIGSDSRKGTALYTGKSNEHAQTNQHADIITLVRVDPQTYTITLLTIPRDTVILGEKAKINDSLLDNKPEEVVEAVERLTGVYADYYMMTSFIQFENLVDALGGIVIDVPRTVTVGDPATAKNVTVSSGKSKYLHGSEALVLARARKEYIEDEDALRQINVRNIEQTIILTALGYRDEKDIEAVLRALSLAVDTNMDLEDLKPLAMDFIEHRDEIVFYAATGPYEGGVRASDELWVAEGNPAVYRQIIALMEVGADPSGIVPAPQF